MSAPNYWACHSTEVSAKFSGYHTAYCRQDCKEEHLHEEQVPTGTMTCRSCGNVWEDGNISEFPELLPS